MKKGFSLAELLMVMVITGVLLMAMMPVFTTKKNEFGTNSNANYCVVTELQNNQTMDISQANCTANPNINCCKAVDACTYDMNNSCETLIFYADNGQNRQRESARKALREACDRGSEKACEYFVKSCAKDNSNCNITSGNATDYDLSFYLGLPSSNNNLGRLKIKDYAGQFYVTNQAYITNLINSLCQKGNESNTACLIRTDSSYGGGASRISIENCNSNDSDACTAAYSNNWNKSCDQIKNNWITALDGTYTLTYNNSGTMGTYKAYCDMENDGGWTLVLKASGNTNTFQYSSSYWTNTTELTPDNADISKVEHKNKAFSILGFEKLKIVMDVNGASNSLVINYSSTNPLRNIFSAATVVDMSNITTRTDWLNLFPNPSAQNNCNSRGFHANKGNWAGQMRLGIVTNGENECNSPDSWAGLGAFSQHSPGNKGAGNYCNFGCSRNTLNDFGYLYIK